MGRTGERPYEDIVRNGPLQDRKRTLTRNQISRNFDHGLLTLGVPEGYRKLRQCSLRAYAQYHLL